MSNKNNILEINGTRYDARTGKVLSEAAHNTGNVDGILTAGAKVAVPAAPTQKTYQPLVAATKTPVMDIARAPAHAQQHHRQEHAKTLMRTAVKKPGASFKRTVSAQSALTKTGLQAVRVSPKLSLQQVDPGRYERSATVKKNAGVSRFFKSGEKEQELLPEQTVHLPVIASPQPVTAQPSLDIFERALRDAPINELPPMHTPSKTHRVSNRVKAATLVSAAVVLVGGFLVYQNVANLNLYMASNRAGFTASLPGYHPSGFGLGNVSASAGAVAATYKSNSDDRAFTISEKPSAMDSLTLLQSIVQPLAGSNYQTIQAAGRTVYIYGNNNATWVNADVWYQLTSQGALSDQQISQIAASL